MERKHWTLLVIDEARPGSLSPLQLQKILFLIGENLASEVGSNFYEFVPYNYGPFDPQVYADARTLTNEGLVEAVQIVNRTWTSYEVTTEGHELAVTIRSSGEISQRALGYITKVVKWVESLTFAQLLSAIYRAFPKYKANSVFVS